MVLWYRALVGVSLLAFAPVAAGQIQGKGIRFIVPYPPGGGGDTLARAIAQKWSDVSGVPVRPREHNDEVLGSMLGHSREELDLWHALGVI